MELFFLVVVKPSGLTVKLETGDHRAATLSIMNHWQKIQVVISSWYDWTFLGSSRRSFVHLTHIFWNDYPILILSAEVNLRNYVFAILPLKRKIKFRKVMRKRAQSQNQIPHNFLFFFFAICKIAFFNGKKHKCFIFSLLLAKIKKQRIHCKALKAIYLWTANAFTRNGAFSKIVK